MFSAIARDPSGDDFPSLGNKILECSKTLVINGQSLINTETTYFSPLISHLISSFFIFSWAAHNQILASKGLTSMAEDYGEASSFVSSGSFVSSPAIGFLLSVASVASGSTSSAVGSLSRSDSGSIRLSSYTVW